MNKRLISLLVGAASAGSVLASISPAQALTWNWSYNDSASGLTASGTLVTNDIPNGSGFYTISSLTGTRNGVNITGLVAPGLGERGLNDNLISATSPFLTTGGFSYSIGVTSYDLYRRNNVSTQLREEFTVGTVTTITNLTFFAANQVPTPVPFNIPGGATIPTIGSLLALGVMRQVKKKMVAGNSVANPVSEPVK